LNKKGLLLRFDKKTDEETDVFFEVLFYLVDMKISYLIKEVWEADRKNKIKGIDFFVLTNKNIIIPIQISLDPKTKKEFQEKGIKVFLFKINRNTKRHDQAKNIRNQFFKAIQKNLLV